VRERERERGEREWSERKRQSFGNEEGKKLQKVTNEEMVENVKRL
jgi:hypothetical protein